MSFTQTTKKIKESTKPFKSTHITLYTGSLKSTYSRYFIHKNKRNLTINTFDDGLGNLVLDGYFSKKDKLFKRIFLLALGIIEPYLTTLKKINNHYTIYKEKNVYENYCKSKIIVPIKTSTNTTKHINYNNNEMRILLTQPYSERGLTTLEAELKAYNLVINKFNITHILPHPSDTPKKMASLETEKINSPNIAEDIISNLSRTKTLEIYAFGSSALINTSTLKNVTCHWLKNKLIPQPSFPHQLFENIDFIEIHDE